jgi:uncharacterized protein (UPF0548 family)
MFLRQQPSPADVEAFLASASQQPLSYAAAALAAGSAGGYRVDEQEVIVGRGEADFDRAKAALSGWKHFELGWLDLFPKPAGIVPGTVVAVQVRHLGFWSLNGCRVVYSIGGDDPRQFGFAYGTLADHAESGEELFKVSLHPRTGEVTYFIHAVSRPRAVLARLGYPVARSLPARLRRDSSAALARAIAGREPGSPRDQRV